MTRATASARLPSLQRELAARVGMAVFLASWAMIFAALLFAHLLLQSQTADTRELPVALAGLSTLVLLASGTLIRLRNARAAALAAAAIGVCFVCAQVLLWLELWDRGLWPTDSQLASSVYALTGFHAVHVVIGILGLWWSGLIRPQGLRWWKIYWDFVAVVWVVIFVVGFLA